MSNFVFTAKTDNTGTSNNDQFTLPLISGGTYDFEVDWGDGSSNDTITAYDDAAVTHTFDGGADTYTVTIYESGVGNGNGSISGWRFANGGDKLKFLLVSSWGPLVMTTNQAFYGCSNFNTSSAGALASTTTSLQFAFYNCSSLTTLDVSGWDTSSVTSLYCAFHHCSSLTTLDVSGWDTSIVTTLQFAFENCSSLTTLDVSGWDTSIVTSLLNAFENCSSLTTLDVSGWDTSSVTKLLNAFYGCSDLTSLDVSSWDTSSVTSLQFAFYNCSSLTTLDVSGWDTSDVTTLYGAFQGCSSLTTLDVSDWDVSNVTTFTNMLSGVTLTTDSYDALLSSFADQSVGSSLTLTAGSSKYTGGPPALSGTVSIDAIGATNSTPTSHLDGQVAMVCVGTGRLSADQVSEMYLDPYAAFRQPARRIWVPTSTSNYPMHLIGSGGLVGANSPSAGRGMVA